DLVGLAVAVEDDLLVRGQVLAPGLEVGEGDRPLEQDGVALRLVLVRAHEQHPRARVELAAHGVGVHALYVLEHELLLSRRGSIGNRRRSPTRSSCTRPPTPTWAVGAWPLVISTSTASWVTRTSSHAPRTRKRVRSPGSSSGSRGASHSTPSRIAAPV